MSATLKQEIDPRVEERLDTGLLGYWYPVLPSWAVHDTPVGITRLSQNIVIWRDGEGGVHALADRCPHRGARLSLGWNLSDRVACWYHGVEVDPTGVVREVPASPKCPMVGEKRVRAYPVQDRHGAIFVYFGENEDDAPPPLEMPEQVTGEDQSHFLTTAMWKCNYRYAVDNVMDPMHGAYLHAVSHSMASGDKTAEMKVRKTPSGLMFEKTGQRGVNFDWVEFGDTGVMWLRLAIPYQKKFGGGEFGIIGVATPIDRDHCMVFFWRTRQITGWRRDVWRFLYRTRLEGLHWAVLEQDRMILEDMPKDARDHEFLYDHDIGLARVRRIMEKKAREQVAATAERSAAE